MGYQSRVKNAAYYSEITVFLIFHLPIVTKSIASKIYTSIRIFKFRDRCKKAIRGAACNLSLFVLFYQPISSIVTPLEKYREGDDHMAEQQNEQAKQWAKVVAKAWADEDYKQRLMDDPASMLAEEGIEMPEGLEIKVVEATDRHGWYCPRSLKTETLRRALSVSPR